MLAPTEIVTALLAVAASATLLSADFAGDTVHPAAPTPVVRVVAKPVTFAAVQPASAPVLHPSVGPDGRLYVEGIVNGTPIRFMLDTAASRSVIGTEDARRLGVVATRTTRVATVGGIVDAHRGRAQSVELGGRRLADAEMLIVPDLPHPLLGMDMIRQLEIATIRL